MKGLPSHHRQGSSGKINTVFNEKLPNTEASSPQETIRSPLDLIRKILLRRADAKRKNRLPAVYTHEEGEWEA